MRVAGDEDVLGQILTRQGCHVQPATAAPAMHGTPDNLRARQIAP